MRCELQKIIGSIVNRESRLYDLPIRRTFRRLDKDRKEHQNHNRGGQTVAVGKDNDHGPFHAQNKALPSQPSRHAPVRIAFVTHVASHATCKQIHPSKDGRNGGGVFGAQTKFLPKIESGGIVHGNFHTKATRVLNKQQPGIDIPDTVPKGLGHVDMFHFL